MNEVIFFLHIVLVVGLILMAARLGKGALTAIVAIQAIFANFFVVKQMSLFGFSVTCSDVFAIGSILGLNLLQENYGRKEANGAVKISFLSLLFFVLMSQVHLWYEPIPADTTQEAFVKILSHTARITFASIAVYYLVQKIDIRLFGYLQTLFQGKRLPVRMAVSLVVTQLLDTLLFSFLGLYGLVESIWDIVFVSFFIKCLIISSSSFLVALSRRMQKNVPV